MNKEPFITQIEPVVYLDVYEKKFMNSLKQGETANPDFLMTMMHLFVTFRLHIFLWVYLCIPRKKTWYTKV